jgi:hypothetical protein
MWVLPRDSAVWPSCAPSRTQVSQVRKAADPLPPEGRCCLCGRGEGGWRDGKGEWWDCGLRNNSSFQRQTMGCIQQG